MNRWVPEILGAAGGIAFIATFAIVLECSAHPPYNHVLTTVERVDEDADALRVYHDKVRGATCYETYGWPTSVSCVPDVWLTSKSAPLP